MQSQSKQTSTPIESNLDVINANYDALLNRYKSIIPNPEALKTTLQSPLPMTAWCNPLKIKPQQLIECFKNSATLQPLSWWTQGFRFKSTSPLGKTWQYLCGLIQIQEEVSMLPALILNPQPGERVLDLCAAPGNKTAQSAVLMRNQGMLFANDCNLGRLRATGQIIKRLGLINVNLCIYDGIQFPVNQIFFDKVIVDAPCSCEGTLRKGASKKITLNPGNSQRLAQTQIALLKKAIQVTQPGGKIVYSTCTFAPEENEAVIDTILKQFANEITLIPITIPNFKFSPGITQWQGRNFNSNLKKTARIWPHQNNTGGFYIALLQKKGASVSRKKIISNCHFQTTERIDQHIDIIKKRFNFSQQLLDQFQYLDHSKRGLYITSKENNLQFNTELHRVNVDCQGLFFIKTKIRFPKLSSSMAMLWGHTAKQNVVQLKSEQIIDFINQTDISLSKEQRHQCLNTGYVIVKHEDYCLGLGIIFARQPSEDWPLRSLFPSYLS